MSAARSFATKRARKSRSQLSLITPESGVAGQCEMPPVPSSAMRSGCASHARRSARPNSYARASGVSGGPWQFTFTGITGKS
jgi:hypothetical protein